LKRLIKSLLRRAGYELSALSPPPTLREENPDVTDYEWDIYSRTRPFTMLSLQRILANVRAIEHIVQKGIPGDIVECGVWRGGSSMAMALALLRLSDTGRTLWMYDTFQGMTDPTDADKSHGGIDAEELLNAAKEHEAPERSLVLAYASLEDVRNNMRTTGYPMNRIRFVEGSVEQTIPGTLPGRIALLRLDTDWYESTRHELIHLYPRLSPDGILIIDDYGHWQGARKAVDEYLENSRTFLSRIDYTGRLAVKASE
jgi:predicted O-methyltransferase YrrM